ncbi:hypothetical protein [Mitsuokella jalaludinii]|uniref:hypothetical protein n=1 Tax=Mitsuokella jalaludinii TaxID=187979 RepID=UPI003C6D5C11
MWQTEHLHRLHREAHRGTARANPHGNSEYVYMPGSELGVKDPVCVYEADGMREDIDMHEALRLIRVRSLKPARHPVWGESSC